MRKLFLILSTFICIDASSQHIVRHTTDSLVNQNTVARDFKTPYMFELMQVHVHKISGMNHGTVYIQQKDGRGGFISMDSLLVVDVTDQYKIFNQFPIDRVVYVPKRGSIHISLLKISTR
jgi:hypothetical protein